MHAVFDRCSACRVATVENLLTEITTYWTACMFNLRKYWKDLDYSCNNETECSLLLVSFIELRAGGPRLETSDRMHAMLRHFAVFVVGGSKFRVTT
jgi:hypothetical protein